MTSVAGGRTAGADAAQEWPEVDRLLAMVRDHLDMEVACLSAFVDGRQVLVAAAGLNEDMRMAVGDGILLDSSLCTRVIAGTVPRAVPDARRHPVARDIPAIHALNIGSYAGVPWHDQDGVVAGMLCCVSRHPTPHLDEHAAAFLELIASLVSQHLDSPWVRERQTAQRASAAVRTVLESRAIKPVFQPVVRLTDGAVVAFESLSRFDPSHFGTPDQAFAAAAHSGLGVDLELLALQRIFENFPAMPTGAWLGVNLSADALLDPRVEAVLLTHADHRVGVEITEHTQVSDYTRLSRATARLRTAGIQIVIDDAGAGFASLSHILQLRPDTIKLDLSIVRGVDTDPVRRALTRSLVAFAEEIGASLIGEGVETGGEHETLRDLGVGFGQGYLLGRPAPLPPGPPARF